MKMKSLLLMTALIGIALLWSGCQKEVSNTPIESPQKRLSGVVPDDPILVSKVPVIMSSDYLSDNGNILFRTTARGSRDKTKPTIIITSPSNGSTVSGTISVTVSASDNIGVKSVTLYIDGGTTAVAGTSIAPFTNTWNSATVSNGTHTLTATAKDAAGNMASSTVSVTVNNAPVGDFISPTINSMSPADGSSFDANTNITINVSAGDDVGISSITLKIDNTLVGSASSSPYSYTWNTDAAGPHTIEARAFDAAGNQAFRLITVTINTVIITPPTLPSSVTLAMPPVQNQGSEGSCTAFATLYARDAEQYFRSGASSYSTTTNIFSPEFLYNQTKVGSGCSSGSAILGTLDFLKSTGVSTWNSMPYSSTNGCSLMPTSSQTAEAASYKISSYSKVYATDPSAVKTMLYNKHPLLFGLSIDNNFFDATSGYVWSAFGTFYNNHSLTLVGYDDSKQAYLAINSWGTAWGTAGYIWIDYDFFPTITYALYVQNP